MSKKSSSSATLSYDQLGKSMNDLLYDRYKDDLANIVMNEELIRTLLDPDYSMKKAFGKDWERVKNSNLFQKLVKLG